MCFLTNVSAFKEIATASSLSTSEILVSLQPEQFIFTAEKLAAIACKLLHQTTKHYAQLLGAELLNKTLLFTLLFILVSLQDRKAKQLLC